MDEPQDPPDAPASLTVRSADELLAALGPEIDAKKYAKPCAKIVKELGADEHVTDASVCLSGEWGVLALTNKRTLFAWRPDAMTMRFIERPLSAISSAHYVGDDHLFFRTQDDRLLGFKQLTPSVAPELAQRLWEHGAERPEGLVPDDPPESLPSRELHDILDALRPADRDALTPHCERALQVLEDEEAVLMAARCTSASPGIVALTPDRLLFAAQEPDARISVIPIPLSALVAARCNSPDELVLIINSQNFPKVVFSEMRPALAQAFAAQLASMGAGDPEAAESIQQSSRADQSLLRLLPGKTRRLAQPHISPDETVFICLVGAFGQALIALADRVLVVKAGFMSGRVRGGRVNAFPYRGITGIEIHTGAATGVLVIQTPSFQGTQSGTYWSSGEHNPAELPNTIPIGGKSAINRWQPHLATLHTAIANGGMTAGAPKHPASLGPPVVIPVLHPEDAPPVAAPTASAGLADELNKLAALHEAGVLSDEEFGRAKAKLLE